MTPRPRPSVGMLILAGIALAMAYYITARLGLMLANVSGTVTLIWPPTGLAVGFLYRFGLRLWPAVAVAAFAVNLHTLDLPSAAGVAVGNTLGVVLAVTVLLRTPFLARFDCRTDVQVLIAAAALGTLVTGGNGALWLCGTGIVAWSRFAEVAAQWWLGDFAGILFVAPAVLTWPRTLRDCFTPLTGHYSCTISTLVLILFNLILYGGLIPSGPWMFGLIFIPFIIIIRTAVLERPWPAAVQLLIELGFVYYSLLYVTGPINFLPPDVRTFASWGYITALAFATLITAGLVGERNDFEREKESGDANYRALVEDNPALICHFQADGQLFFANETFRRYFGLQIGMTAGRNLFSVTNLSEDELFQERLAEMNLNDAAATTQHPSASTLGLRWIRWTARPVKISSGRGVEFHAVGLDVTEQVEAEEQRYKIETQAIQTHKLESVGMIADGIAHEFNNLLTGVLGNAELAQTLLPRTSAVAPLLEEVCHSAQRAAALTRQLLNYASRDGLQPEPLDLSELVRSLNDLLTVAVPKRSEFKLDLAEGLPLVKANDARLRQLLMSLVSNAGEAVHQTGGRVTVRTAVVDFNPLLDRFAMQYGDENPGGRVLLQIEDEGEGIRLPDQARVFEPFFTTRTPGRGLGLAAVLGIVREHGGTVGLCSRAGRGTVVSVLLPPLEPIAPARDSAKTTHSDCKLCTAIDDTTDTPPEFTLPLPPFQKMAGTDHSGWSSQVRSRSRRPRMTEF